MKTLNNSNIAKSQKSTLILCDGQKGGLGKSTVARAIVHCLASSGFPVLGFDADPTNPHLRRYCSKQIDVECVHLRERSRQTQEEDGWQTIGNAVGRALPGSVLLVDLPAGILGPLATQLPQLQRLCGAYECRIIRVWVIDGEDDSVRLLKASKDLIPSRDTIVVRNGRDGHPDSFDIWENSGVRKDLLTDGGSETYLHFLPENVRGRIRKHQWSFAEALASDLAPYERVELEIWLEGLDDTFAPLLDMLRS